MIVGIVKILDIIERPTVFWSVRIGLAVVLAASAYTHRANPFLFYDAFLAYRWPVGKLAVFLSCYLPVLQLLLAGLLLVPVWNRAAAWLTSGFSLLLVIAQISALTRGLTIECGCFTGYAKEISWQTIGLAGFLFLLSLHLALKGHNGAKIKGCESVGRVLKSR
ncbi:MAG TPA: MauE/DoxX family redox-associated membrane protein [Pirellulaceae bacterium]|nr:MauE/DoxX family redox-associated membrane protein [Pirellulaceae bacterium]